MAEKPTLIRGSACSGIYTDILIDRNPEMVIPFFDAWIGSDMGVGYKLNATQINTAFRINIWNKITEELALILFTALETDSVS